MSAELVRYDAMCSAIAECHSVDEVADLQNKARALELYARQARNTDAERKAASIRIRAEVRAGVLFAELKRATPAEAGAKGNAAMGRASNGAMRVSPYAETLERTGITPQTAHRWQQLAAVPSEQLEAALAAPAIPSTAAILRSQAEVAHPMDADALWIWGRVRDFERERLIERSPGALVSAMTESMRDDLRRILPTMIEWMISLSEVAT